MGSELNGGVATLEAPVSTTGSLAGKYLTFHLGGEEYALPILKVREIIGLMEVTTVPRTPDFVRGVINLRGKVISVVDLRRKFALPRAEDTSETCVIVVEVDRQDRILPIGLLVDQVSEVRDIAAEQTADVPEFGAAVRTDFLLGLGKVGQAVMMLLDIDCILSADEVAQIDAASR